jgi:hypothetical protein
MKWIKWAAIGIALLLCRMWYGDQIDDLSFFEQLVLFLSVGTILCLVQIIKSLEGLKKMLSPSVEDNVDDLKRMD